MALNGIPRAEIRVAPPYLLALLGGALFALLKADVNWQLAAAYGPSSSLYAAFNFFLACSLFGGCLLAAGLAGRLRSGPGRLACFGAAALPLLLSRVPAPAGAWGAGIFTDCLLKCLFFYGPYFAVLTAVPVLISVREAPPAGEAPGARPAFVTDVSLRFFGFFCLGAGLAALIGPDAGFSGGNILQIAYALFAGLSMLYLFRPDQRREAAASKPAGWRVAMAGAGIAAWCVVTPYMMLIASGSVSDDPAHRALFFALALCFIPALRSYLTRLSIIAATLGVLVFLVFARDPLPALLFLLLLQQGRRVCWLKEESGLPGFCVVLAAGALGGALLGCSGILWMDGSLSAGDETTLYSLFLPLMWVWIFLIRRGRVVYKTASEHGAYEVVDKHMGYRVLLNRKIDHGSQFFEGTLSPAPGSYYSPDSPAAQVLRNNRFEKVALVGLGAGALCHYAERGARWTIYELDPEIVRIARTYFTFLARCEAGLEIVPGDAGKTLPAAPEGEFDLIILDAYTGGELPEHLVLPETFLKFGGKLRKGGALLVHATGHRKRLLTNLRPFAAGGARLAEKASPVWNVMRSDWILAGAPALVERMGTLNWKLR